MTIRVDLTPEEEAQLREGASRRGAAPETFAAELLRAQLSRLSDASHPTDALPPVVDENGVFHESRWQAVEERLRRISSGCPPLPGEALTRESLYQDHD